VYRLSLVHQFRKRQVQQRFNVVNIPSAGFFGGSGTQWVEGEGLGQNSGHERGGSRMNFAVGARQLWYLILHSPAAGG
jgi:hypothetical protein